MSIRLKVPKTTSKNSDKAKKPNPESKIKQAQPGRDEKGRLLPGYTGNAGGRPAVAGEVKKLARQYTDRAISTLAKIMDDEDAPRASRVLAANSLLDRGYGRPVQQLEVGRPGDFSDMQEHEIDAFIAKASGELAHLHADGFAVH